MNGFMKNMRISLKLLISSVVFLLPIAVLFYFFLSGVNATIQFGTFEIEGNRYQRPLETLLTYVPEYGRLFKNGDTASVQRRDVVRHLIDDAFKQLVEADAAVGADLQFTPEGLAKRNQSNLRVELVKAAWDGEAEKTGDVSTLVKTIQDIIAYAGNTSNLILDPDLDTYYFMDVTLLAIPQTQGRLADILDFGSKALTSGKLSIADRIRFAVYAALLEESDYNRVVASTGVALKEDQNFYGINPPFQQIIPGALESYKKPTEAFITLLKNLGNPIGSTVSRGQFLNLGNAANEAAYTYWKTGVDRLDGLLQVRIDSYSTTRFFGVSMTLLAIILASLLVFAISRGITSSIGRIQEFSQDLANGRLVIASPVNQKDEVGAIGRSLQALQENLRNILKSEIRSTVEVITGSILDLTSSSQQISVTSNQQAAAVKEIVSTMEDSDRLSKGIAEKITSVTQLSENTRDKVNSGFEIINFNRSTMDEIRLHNDETIEGINNLAGKIENIYSIVNLINNIANQTKIIAFNAELESASAVATGKSFEIVANEIRRLAENTGNSTSEIRAIISEIQKASEILLDSSRAGTEKIGTGQSLSNQLQSLFSEILSAADLSAGSAGQIASLIQQQVQAFEQILLTLKQISEGIDGFVTSTKTTIQTSEGLKKMAGDLERILDKFELDA